jgi:serine phosphatase RsbU (regulator of sigma subunit)
VLFSLLITLIVAALLTQTAVFSTTIYLHRTATHKALVIHPALEWTFRFVLWVITGVSTREWVAVHRKHHAFTDEEGDPHSPRLLGFWKVQLGNVFYYIREVNKTDVVERYARDIQQGLQPSSMPTAGWFRAAGSSLPSTQVGGDYFDVHPISPHAWAAVVADVSGKGVSSALLASLLQGMFVMTSDDPLHIEPRLTRLNEFLLERTRGEKYATVFYCILDSSGLLSYANAGHCAPFLVSRDGRLRSLHTTSMPVGMIEGVPFQTVQTQLEPGDKIVIYSDGLTEAEGVDGAFFDTDRLRKCLRDGVALGAAALHASLLETLDRSTDGGTVRDDITALVLQYCPE